ncbi:MAG: hypothetical protein QGG36_28975 [Pirellulaceae bacterium]|nr:hypothetical protein [Pirellulaceae bacterium]
MQNTLEVDDEDIDINATATVDFAAAVTTTNGGAVTITNGGQLTMAAAADFNLDGAFTQDGAGPVATAGDITATSDAVNFNGAVALTGDVNWNTGAGTGDVTLASALDGDQLLSITAGTGDVTFQAAIGATTALNGLAVVNSNSIDLQSTLAVDDQGIDFNASSVDFAAAVTTTNGGAVAITNGGQLTIAAAADFNLDGDFAQDGAGLVATAGNITTTSDAVSFNSAITLTGDAAWSSGAGGGDVAVQSSVDGDYKLTIAAGGGDVDLQGAVGSATTLNGLAIASANNVTFSATVDVDDEDLDINANGTVDVADQLTTTGGGQVVITNGALLTVAGGASLSLDGQFVQDGAGAVQLGDSVTTTSDAVSVSGPLVLAADVTIDTGGGAGFVLFQSTLDGTISTTEDLTITAGTGDVSFQGAVGQAVRLGAVLIATAGDVTANQEFNSLSITQLAGMTTHFVGDVSTTGAAGVDLTANAIRFDGDLDTNGAPIALAADSIDLPNSITAPGATIRLNPATASTPIGLADAAQPLNFTAAELSAIDAARVVVGDATHAGGVRAAVDASLNVSQHLEIVTNGTVVVSGAITTTGGGDLLIDQDGLLTIAPQGDLALAGSFHQSGAGATSTAGDIVTAGGDVHFEQAVSLTGDLLWSTSGGNLQLDADLNGGAQLTVAAGAGDVRFDGSIGSTSAIAGLAVSSADQVDFAGPVDTLGGGLDVTGVIVNSSSTLSSTNGGELRLANSGLATLTGDVSVDGAFRQIGSGPVELTGDITTTNDAITVNGALQLNGNTLLDTGAGGGDVQLQSDVDGSVLLTITAGGGDLTTGSIGSNTRLAGLLITARDVDLQGAISVAAQTLDIDATGATRVGDIDTDSGGTVTISNSGVLTIRNGAVISADGAFHQDGSGSVSLGGNIATTDDDAMFDGDVALTANASVNTSGGAGDIRFGGTVDGGFLIAVAAGGGDASFAADVGVGTRLVGLNASAQNIDFGGEVHVGGSGVTTASIAASSFAGSVSTTSGGAADLVHGGDLTVSPGGFALDGPFDETGGGVVRWSGNLSTTADDIDFSNAVELTGAAQFDTGVAGGDVALAAIVDGANSLSIAAGTGGVSFSSAIGGSDPLAALAVSSAGSIQLLSNVEVGAGGIGLNSANTVLLAEDVTTTSGGSFQIANGGLLTVAASTWDVDGAFAQSGGGAVQWGADLTTTDDAISIGDGTQLTRSVTLNSNGGDIALAAVDGSFRLTVDAGGGDIDGQGDVGKSARLSGIDVLANSAHFQRELHFGSQSANISTAGAVQLDGDLSSQQGGALSIVNGGDLTWADTTADLDGPFAQTGAGDVFTAVDLTTTGDDLLFQSPITLIGGSTYQTAGGAVAIGSVDLSTHPLVIDSGQGDVDLTAGVSGGGGLTIVESGLVELGVLQVSVLDVQDAHGDVSLAGLNQTSGDSRVSSDGAIHQQAATQSTGAVVWQSDGAIGIDSDITASGVDARSGGDIIVSGAIYSANSDLLLDAGGDVVLNNSPANYDVEVDGAGRIEIYAGGDVQVADGALLKSADAQYTNARPLVDASSPEAFPGVNVDLAGNVDLDASILEIGVLDEETNFVVAIAWQDGTNDTFPPQSNTSGNGTGPPFDNIVVDPNNIHRFHHQYDLEFAYTQADPLPVELTISHAPSIQLFADGDRGTPLSTTVIVSIITPSPPSPERPPLETPQGDPSVFASNDNGGFADDIAETIDETTSLDGHHGGPPQFVVETVGDGAGAPAIADGPNVAGELPHLIQTLPDNRYRFYRIGADGQRELVLDVRLQNGEVVERFAVDENQSDSPSTTEESSETPTDDGIGGDTSDGGEPTEGGEAEDKEESESDEQTDEAQVEDEQQSATDDTSQSQLAEPGVLNKTLAASGAAAMIAQQVLRRDAVSPQKGRIFRRFARLARRTERPGS